jgi:peptide/nickel transport system substrate-binding protein
MVRKVIELFILFCLCAAMLGAMGALAQPLHTRRNDAPVLHLARHPEQDSTLDICLEAELNSLYLYSDPLTWANGVVWSAIYDGPIDDHAYAYQPVILQRLPSLENGDARLEAITVNAGALVLNDSGTVVTLIVGEVIRPSGCRSSDCAITYTGGSVDMDRLQVDYFLLPGLTWSDGELLTASDSVYSFILDADPMTPSRKERSERTAAYSASSDEQVTWTSLPGFTPADFATYFWTPLPEHLWGIYTAEELLTADLSNRTPLGWGPYVIDEWVTGERINLHKNPNYFRTSEGLPEFESLVFHFTSDGLGDLRAGNCDILPSTLADPGMLRVYDNQGYYKVTSSPDGITWEHLDFGIQPVDSYDGFAGQTLAFQDLRVRQAFAYCMDRRAIVEAVYAGYGGVAHAYIPTIHPYYPDDAAMYPFDPVQGQALLAAAGWVDTNGNGVRDKSGIEFSVDLVTSTANIRQVVAALVAEQMSANCGIAVIPNHIPANDLFAGWPDGPLFGRQFDLGIYAWLTGVEPPCIWYHTDQIPSDENPGGMNDTGYSDPTYDLTCDSALQALYEHDKLSLHGEAVRIFTEDLPVLPLFARVNLDLMIPQITHFQSNPMNYHTVPNEYRLWNIEEYAYGESETILPEGGELLSPEDGTSYAFASGTFGESVEVKHISLSPKDTPDFEPFQGAGHFFEVSAMDGQGQSVQPDLPYTLTIQYTDGELGHAQENTLGLFYWDENLGAWVAEPSAQVDPVKNSITAHPHLFSIWAVLGDTKIIYLPVIKQ